MATPEDENVALVAEVEALRSDLAQARLRIAAMEQALETRWPALDEAHAKIAKYRLEIVGLYDQARAMREAREGRG